MTESFRLGFFIQPVHPPTRAYADVLREDREAVALADALGYREAFVGEHLADSAETIRDLNQHHLRALLACGVTTVMDPAGYPPVVREIQAWLAAGNPGPRFLTTGPYFRVPGGYGSEFHFGVDSTPEEVEKKLDLLLRRRTFGFEEREGKRPHAVLGQISRRIINEVPGINRVVYGISSQPPATIEWE